MRGVSLLRYAPQALLSLCYGGLLRSALSFDTPEMLIRWGGVVGLLRSVLSSRMAQILIRWGGVVDSLRFVFSASTAQTLIRCDLLGAGLEVLLRTDSPLGAKW